MMTEPDEGDAVKGLDLPPPWHESLEALRREIATYEAIPTDGLMQLVGEAYDNVLASLRDIAAMPREFWAHPRAGEAESEYLGWCIAIGKVMVTMWQRGLTWLPPDEPRVVGKEVAHE